MKKSSVTAAATPLMLSLDGTTAQSASLTTAVSALLIEIDLKMKWLKTQYSFQLQWLISRENQTRMQPSNSISALFKTKFREEPVSQPRKNFNRPPASF
jgi:hypothetical protein